MYVCLSCSSPYGLITWQISAQAVILAWLTGLKFQPDF